MSWFRNLSLAKKLYGLVGVLLALLVLMAVVSISSLSSGSSPTPTIVVLVLGLALGAGIGFFTVHQLTGSVKEITEWPLAGRERAGRGSQSGGDPGRAACGRPAGRRPEGRRRGPRDHGRPRACPARGPGHLKGRGDKHVHAEASVAARGCGRS